MLVLGIIGLILLIPDKAYSSSSSEVTWELVVISSKPVCTGNHFYLMEKYYDIANEYLELYQLNNTSYEPQCMTEFEYIKEYEKPHDLDLIIFVYDRDLGRADLHKHNAGGMYIHQGDDLSTNHTIIFCDCSNFYYSDPVWILSHELSHFVLNYLGFDLDVAEDEIHQLDQKFDTCVEKQYDESCSSVKTRIETDRSLWTVMAPYEPAIGKEVPKPNSDKAVFDSYYQAKIILEITDWWLQGDISNENYVKSLQILSGEKIGDKLKTKGILAEPPLVVFTEPPSTDKTQQVSEDFSKYPAYLLDMSPFSSKGGEDFSAQDKDIFILWLKTKAQSWSEGSIRDGELLKDLEYLLNSPQTGMYLNYLENLSSEELLEKGIEFQQAGEFRNAKSYFDRAIIKNLDSDISSAESLILKGDALNGLGQYEEALIFFDNALEVEPKNSVALKKKAFTLAQLGEIEKAKYYFEISQQIEN